MSDGVGNLDTFSPLGEVMTNIAVRIEVSHQWARVDDDIRKTWHAVKEVVASLLRYVVGIGKRQGAIGNNLGLTEKLWPTT